MLLTGFRERDFVWATRCIITHEAAKTVTVTESFVLRPLLGDQGRITFFMFYSAYLSQRNLI